MRTNAANKYCSFLSYKHPLLVLMLPAIRAYGAINNRAGNTDNPVLLLPVLVRAGLDLISFYWIDPASLL